MKNPKKINDNNNVKLTRKQKKLIKKQNQLGEEHQKVAQKLQEEEQKQLQKREKAERARDSAKVGVLLGTLIPGIILLFITIFTLNLWAMIFGFILFAIGMGIWSWESGSYQAKRGRHGYKSSFYANRWGSANAKRNISRAHWYSKRK
jgi:Flp pilus assembly protein TadB